MLGCQAAGSAAMVEGRDVPDPDTVATAIRIGAPVRREEAAAAALDSGGAFVAVPDEEILHWFRRLASEEGVFCEPSSATSVAGLARAVASGDVVRGSRVVCVLTGHGLKDPDTAIARADAPIRVAATFDALEAVAFGS